VPSSQYDSILYSEIAPRLRQIETSSNRVKVDVIGQSAGGRNLFFVTVSAPEAMGRLGQYQAIRQMMLKDPEKAQEMIDRFGDFKVPVFINGSIHGNEYPGTDAAIRLIETLAYDDSEEVRAILDNVILLVNVVQNPDGRVLGTRANANGIDLNRDFITQSQPEVRATVKIFKEWNPMVVLDLHGFVNPMLIEPCTPPHNPNYEYDLYITWAYRLAEAMEAELFDQTGFGAQIPFRDDALGWDDWPPTYTPMYGMFHGGYGATLETPYRDSRGVDAHFAAVWGALKYVVENRQAMIHDQIEIFRRGFLDLPQMLIPDEILNETQYNQYNELTIKEFPAGYIIPKDVPLQLSAHQPARLVQFLLDNDIQVEQAVRPFSFEGVDFPADSYIVWMDQPKRGLANTILESGLDLSGIQGLTFYSPPSVWSNPLLWGTARWVMPDRIDIQTRPVQNPDQASGSIERGRAEAFAYSLTSLNAFRLTNELAAQGVPILRSPTGFEDGGRVFAAGTIIAPGDPNLGNQLANQYGMDVSALGTIPTDLVSVVPLRIAVSGDSGLTEALKALGFSFTVLSAADMNAGALANFDVYINQNRTWNQINAAGRASFLAFMQNGGEYVGLLNTGVGFARNAGLTDATSATGNGNTIVRLHYDRTYSLAAGFRAEDYAFVNTPLWFTSLGTNPLNVVATLDGGDFVVSGYWPGWPASGAAGSPVVVQGSYDSGSFALLGIDAVFRGHPENTFRLIGNAIYEALK
jgi:hypothetical protein